MERRKLLDTPENIEDVRNKYLVECLTVKELASSYNCSTAVIQRFLHKHSILKVTRFKPTEEELLLIRKCLIEGKQRKEIAKMLNVQPYLVNRYVNKEILNKGLYKNTLSTDTWIINKTSLFWYFLGIFASDGHLGNFNEVCLFLKDGQYLKELLKLIGHSGKLYGDDKTCYTLHIVSNLLHSILESYGFSSDKRYNAPFIKCDSNASQILYLRGLFDGDGSIYYSYTSGRFEGISWQICSGSEEVCTGIIAFLKKLDITAHKEESTSKAGNKYYHITVRSKDAVVKLFNILYKNNRLLCLKTKYKRFLKLIKLIELNMQVDDIVDTSMKIED